MSLLTTSRRLSTTRMVISTCCCIPHRTLILAFSGKVFISSSVLFHSVGKPVCSFITSSASRFWGAGGSIGVLASQYIDYWHIGQTFTAPLQMTWGPSFQRALVAACVMCYLHIEVGYFIGLDKSQSTPSTWVCFLGSVCD